MGLKGRKKQLGIKRFFNSFKYSWDGLKYAYLNEQSLLIHTILTVLAVSLGILLRINVIEWLILFLIIVIVLATELLNTAIEAVVDMVMPDINPLAKIAKDTASAAVFVLSILSVIISLVIFVPNFVALVF